MSPIVTTMSAPAGRVRRPAYSGGTGGGSAFFTDTFSSGDLTKTENGVNWFSAVNCSVIDTATVGLPLNPSNSGKALQFRYNIPGNRESWSELSFNLVASEGDSGYTELYMRWYQYFPTGSEGGTVGPQWYRTDIDHPPQGGTNNKLFRLFETYGRGATPSTRATFGASTRGTNAGQASGARTEGCEIANFDMGGPGFYESPGEVTNTTGFPYAFTPSANRGSWVKVEFRIKSPTAGSTSQGIGTGIMQMWLNDTLVLDHQNASQAPTNAPMKSGYLMGYQNSTMDYDNSRTYITDVAFSATGRV